MPAVGGLLHHRTELAVLNRLVRRLDRHADSRHDPHENPPLSLLAQT
jgi:hypothetical protein